MVASRCPEMQEDLVPLAYGRLEAQRRSELEKHLAECPGCRRELASLKAIRGMLLDSPLPTFHLPREEDFVERVMTTVRLQPVAARKPSTRRFPRRLLPRTRPHVQRPWFLLLCATGVAAALLAAAGWWVLESRNADKGALPLVGREAPAVAEAPSVEKLLEQARQAGSAEQIRALAGALARAADREAARLQFCPEKWSYLTLAEILASSADRAEYRPALVCALQLAAAGAKEDSARAAGEARSAPVLEAARGLLVAGKAGEAGGLLAQLPVDAPESPVIAGQVLARRIRETLAEEPPSGQEWERLRKLDAPCLAGMSPGLAADLAGIARGDLAAAALDYDRALVEWRSAEDRLAAGRPELAASLGLRAACLTLLLRGRARDAGELLKSFEGHYGRSDAVSVCRRELAKTFADENRAEQARAAAFLTAMGIPFDLRRQVLAPLGTTPSLGSESIPITNYDLKDMVVLLQFLRPLALSAPGRGTVVTGQVRLSACSVEKPIDMLICAQASAGRVAVERVKPPLHGMTYRLRIAVWEAAGAGSPLGLHASLSPEGMPARPVDLSARAGKPQGATGPRAGGCVVQCLGKNVAQLELINLQLRTDVDLAAPVPW